MVNDDVIIKFVRNTLGLKTEWPEPVRCFRRRMNEMKKGFPGIRNDHLDIISKSNLRVGDIFISDYQMFNEDAVYDRAPKMFYCLPDGVLELIGIGRGLDLEDKERLVRVGDYGKPEQFQEDLIGYAFRVNVRPTSNGGPGYTYFFKSYRDQRI